MDVLSSRIVIRCADLPAARQFYTEVLGLAVYREFGDPANRSQVYFTGNGYVEVTHHGYRGTQAGVIDLWLQVRDVVAERERLSALGVEIIREPVREPWGLIEMTILAPDGVHIVMVQVPADHPIRRDQRQI
jgi:catechol 2,3-dioxygenase-like lactoylglutathione lyase family enzyme